MNFVKSSNSFDQGFIPRGEHTLTSRLFVFGKIKDEIDRQLEVARGFSKSRVVSSTKTPSLIDPIELNQDQIENDFDYEDDQSFSTLFEDLTHNPDGCVFSSKRQKKCFSNRQVYRLIDNRSDLMKISKNIQQQLYRPDEQMCTSIDLSE